MPAKPGELAITGATIRGIKPTESELKILFGLIENLLAPIEADLDAAAKSAGLKDRKSFRVMYHRFRVKYGLPNGAKVTATAADAAAEQAIAAGEDQQITVASSFDPVSSSMFPASATAVDAAGIDTTMEGMEEPGSEAAEALALALEVNAAAEAEAEVAAVNGSAD